MVCVGCSILFVAGTHTVLATLATVASYYSSYKATVTASYKATVTHHTQAMSRLRRFAFRLPGTRGLLVLRSNVTQSEVPHSENADGNFYLNF